jgi:hypothetical protein
MDWNSHFQKVFFETWQKAGLPHHHDFLPAYYNMLEQHDIKDDPIKNSTVISPGIDHVKLYGVYAFGKIVGKVFADLLGLNATISEHTSDWCGRFNLGISLFDYISDEMDGFDNVVSLKIFQPFIKTVYSDSRSLTAAEELLSNLAGSVLNDLKKASIKKDGSRKTGLLFKVMKQLFNAQNFVSKQKLSADADLKKIKKALYLKSAGPFRIMAEYTAHMADTNNKVRIKNARAIGKAVGYCYWLIDDAKDVWIDLEAGQWNLLLLLAAAEHPEIFLQSQDAFSNDRLVSIWKQSNHVQKMSNQIIKRLAHAIKQLGISKEVEHHSLGLVSASLWQWNNY